MEFLGIGWQELVLVMVLLLVVVGPERLPGVAYQIGRAVRTMQQYARAVRDEFSDEIGYVEDQYKVLKGEVDLARSTLQAEEAKLSAQINQASTELTQATAALAEDPAKGSPSATSSPEPAVAPVDSTNSGGTPTPPPLVL